MSARSREVGARGRIPVIDLADYRSGRAGSLAATAAAIRYALEEIGFFVVVGHGVDPALVERTFVQARRFHARPLEWKMALKMNEHNNGYMAINRYMVQTSEVNRNDKPDLNEAFFTKRERRPDDPLRVEGRRFAGPNVWPEDLPGFRETVLEYTDAVDSLGLALLPAVACALDLPPDYLDASFVDSQFSFRLSHYPPVEPAPNQFGIAPHTDANFMTFLAQTPVAGLEVRMPDGEWERVPYLENSFAVNSGDMLHRWTNRRFKSTPHRVIPPAGVHRYAIPYFLGPSLDARIECLPTCRGPGNPPQFEPIRYYDYLVWWYDANYDARRQYGEG